MGGLVASVNVTTLRFNGDVPLVLLLSNVILARMKLPFNPELLPCHAPMLAQPVLLSIFASVQSKVPLVTSVIMHTPFQHINRKVQNFRRFVYGMMHLDIGTKNLDVNGCILPLHVPKHI